MANENEQPQNTTAAPESTPPAAPTQPPAAATPAPTVNAPSSPNRGGGGKPQDKRRSSPRGDRGPQKRIPALDSDFQIHQKHAPNVRDLDAEIAGELEAALQGMDVNAVYSADSSQRARNTAAAQADQGKKIGTILSIRGPDVFVNIPGGRSEGVLSMEQFPDGPPKIGSQVEVTIEGFDPSNGLLILSRQGAAVVADWSSIAEGMVVEARVLETNKGGLSVDVNGIKGFMPISQIDRFRIETAEQFVNQKLLCIVTDVDKQEHNLVVSRRALLEKERDEQREKLWTELAEGQIREGIVGNVRDFGAFIDLGGVDGLLHVSEISWKRIADATEVLQVGQKVKVVILKIDAEKRKLSLGLKQLESSPWDNIHDRFSAGRMVNGKVTRTMDFGAFVELEPGIEGLIHISELARNKVWRVVDVVKPGQDVEVKILSVDSDSKRISLSLKAALPEDVVKSEEEEEEETGPIEPAAPRVRNYVLKGGMGAEIRIPEPGESGASK